MNYYGYGPQSPNNQFVAQLQGFLGSNPLPQFQPAQQQKDVGLVWSNNVQGFLNPVNQVLQGKGDGAEDWRQGKKHHKEGKGKHKKGKADQQFYQMLVSGVPLPNLAPQYTYNYSDGYAGDKDKRIREFVDQQNQQSANSFVPFDPCSQQVVGMLDQFAQFAPGQTVHATKVGAQQSFEHGLALAGVSSTAVSVMVGGGTAMVTVAVSASVPPC